MFVQDKVYLGCYSICAFKNTKSFGVTESRYQIINISEENTLGIDRSGRLENNVFGCGAADSER